MSESNYKVYPKDILHLNITINQNQCFIIMPFRDDLNKVYGELKSYFGNKGIICKRADELKSNPIIIDSILKGIICSEYIIADITYLNPNVFYELGIAQTVKDAENVIIIKQQGEKCPFDLTHIRYIEYQTDNLFLLKSELEERINQTKANRDFYNMIYIKGIADNNSAFNDDFIRFIKANFENMLVDITAILRGDICSEERINYILDSFEGVICELLNNNRNQYLSSLIKLYNKIIVASAYSNTTYKHVKSFVLYRFNQPEYSIWLTDLMIMLAEDKRFFKLSMDWIINYFSISRAASIDLNRYSLEKFLMLSDDKDVDKIIVESLYSPNKYVREYMADIIGEKKLVSAIPVLFNLLETEENSFVLRSCIHAISKLGDESNLNDLIKWIDKNYERFIQNNDSFILNHFFEAIKRMDKTKDKEYLNYFERLYGLYLNSEFKN